MLTPIGKLPPNEAAEFVACHPDVAYGSSDVNGFRRIVTYSKDPVRITELQNTIRSIPQSSVSNAMFSSSEIGLGDRVKQALTLAGITETRVSNWLGVPCNCSSRIEKLNRLGEWVNGVLSGVVNAVFPDS